jgi:glycosyltransferase involved in cell wall biosynthesis
MSTCFVLVTPSYNLARFIDQTIYSVVGQNGDFSIYYHVQDGNSSDGTREILERWQRLTTSGDFPRLCKNVNFSYEIGSDTGMYDAINRGFELARSGRGPCVMSWINADDVLLPGALSVIASFFQQNPSAKLAGGRPAMMSEEGFLFDIYVPSLRMTGDIADGLHDGRSKDFIMQEGTFWRSELWDQVGGLNKDLRYAGDFDLWRRFASHAHYHSIDTLTGCHRKRDGQLSSNTAAYYAEIDKLPPIDTTQSVGPGDFGYFHFNPSSRQWRFFGGPAPKWRGIRGIWSLEGPFSQIDVESAAWVVEEKFEIAVWSEHSGDMLLVLDFRNPFNTQKVEVNGVTKNIKRAPIAKKISISTPFTSKRGWNRCLGSIETLAPEPSGSRKLGILLEDARLEKKNLNGRPSADRPFWGKFFA